MTPHKKNPAAVALGKRSRASLTPAELRAHAMRMVRARRAKKKDPKKAS